MAGKNDFTLTFGSNASTFAEQLVCDLQPVRKEVADIAGLLRALPALASQQGKLAASNLKSSGGAPAGAHPTGGGGGEGPDFKGMARDLAEYNGSLGKVFSQIEKIVKVLGPITKEMKRAQETQNRSRGGRQSLETRAANGEGRVGGGFAGKGRAGDQPLTSLKNTPKGAVPVTFATTPKLMIDDAAFKRVVNALDRNTAALKSMGKGVRAAGGVPVVAAAGGAGGGAQQLTKAQRKALALQAAAIQEELDGLRQEASGQKVLQSEKKAARRAESQAARDARLAARGDQGLNRQQRANVQRDLDIGATGERGLRGIPKDDLRRIAKSFQGEGFDPGFNPMQTKAGGKLVTNDRLIQAILKMNAELAKTGKTFHDLTTKSTAESISPDAKRIVDGLVQAAKITPQEQQAYDLRRQDRQSGGFGPPLKGRQQVGGDFQQGDAARWVHAAEELINKRNNQRVPTAAIDEALKHISAGRNVFDPQIEAGIKGKGGDAKDAKAQRSALNKIREATLAIDKLVDEAKTLPGAISKAERAVHSLREEASNLGSSPNFKNQEALAAARRELSASTERAPGIRDEVDALQAKAKGKVVQEFTERNAAQLKDLNAAIKAEAAARREMRKKIVKETSDPRTMDMNERLKSQIARSADKGKVLESQAANLRGIRAGSVTTSGGLNKEEAARLKQLLDIQRDEIEARKVLKAQIRKLSDSYRRAGGGTGDAANDLVKAERKLARLLAHRAELEESGALGLAEGLAASSKYTAGRTARKDPAAAMAEEREKRGARILEETQNARALKEGATAAYAGGRLKTRAKAGSLSPESFASGLPGIRVPTRGRDAGTFKAVDPKVTDPDLLKEMNQALAASIAKDKQIAALRKEENKDLAKIAELEKQRKNDLVRMLNAYDQMGLQSKGFGARRIGFADDGSLDYNSNYGDTASQKSSRKKRIAGESDDAYQARLAAIEADKSTKTKKAATQRTKAATDEAKAAKDIADASAKDVKSAKQRNQAADLLAAGAAREKQSGRGAIGGGTANSARKKQNADIAGERGTQDFAAIQAALSATTRKEIEYYRALVATNEAGKNNAKIAEHQVKLYAMMANELGALGRTSSGIRQSFQTVSANVGQQTTVPGAQGVARSANMRGLISSQSPQMAQEATNVRDVIAGKLFGNHGFWSRVANSTGTFIIRNFTAGIVFGLTAALSDVVRQAIVTESTFVRVSHALEATGRASGDLRTQLQGISTDYGTSLEDVYTTAAGLTGLFDSIDEIAGATRVSAQLQMISGGALNATEAMGALASITSAFGDQLGGLDGLEHIADVLTVIQNRVGVNIEVTAEGVGRLAGLAHQIGLTFEETAVYVGEIAKKTNQTGAAAGEQFSRIVAVMQTGRGQKALTDSLGDKGIGAALGAGNYGQALQILMKNYNDLTEAQQRNIAVTLGGQRQAASLAALLRDGSEALDTVRAAEDSRGQAEKRATAISKTLNVVLERFQQNLVTLGAALVRSGVLDFFGLLLMGVNNVLAAANTLLSTFNDLAGANKFTKFISNTTVAVIGLALALKLLKAGMAGLSAYMKASPARAAGVSAVQGSLAGVAGPAGGETIAQRARRTARDRVVRVATATRATGPEMSTAPRSLSNPFGSANRLADPLSGPTSRMGRGMEAVTSGPLRRLGSGLENLGTKFGRLSTITAGLGQSGRSTAFGWGRGSANWSARRVNDLSQATQLTLRGRGDLVAEAASRRLARGASSIRDSASAVAGTGMRATLSRTGLNAVAGSAAVASTSMSRLAVGLRAVSFGGAAAQGAMAGLTLVLTAVVMEMIRSAEYAKDVQNAYEASFGSDRNKTAAQKQESYIGPATDAVKANRNNLDGVTGYMRALGQTYNPKNLFRNVDELGDRAAGNLDTDKLNELGKPWREGLNKLRDRAGQSFTNVDDQVKALTSDSKEIQDELKAKADEIANDSSLSAEQKATGLADLEQSKKSIEDVTASLILRVQGLAELSKLTASRIDELNNMAGFLTQSPTAGANYGSSVNLLMQNSGAGQGNSAMDKAFKNLAAGQGSTADFLRNQLDITNGLVKAAEANLATKLGNGEPEEVEAAASQLQSLIGNAEGLKRQIIDAETKAANELATYLAGRGDYSGAEAALAQAAQNLRNSVEASKRELERRAKDAANPIKNLFGGQQTAPGVSLTPDILTDDESTNRLNQAADLGGQSVTQAVQGKTREQRAALRNTRNAVEVAKLQEEIARIKLKAIQDAFKIGNATQEQVDAAMQEAVDTTRNSRDQAQAATSAGYAAASAGQLNSVSKARTDEAGAWQAVAYAGREFKTNSAEYLNALAAARQASLATQQAILDQAAAQRETALALMAPEDMVGRANKTLDNARAAQQDAKRFGTASTQYQQATQGVIEAQRGVDAAMAEIVDANSNLAIAMATAAGNMVDVANLKLEQARKELARAKKKSGGKRTAAVINAEAGVATAKGDQRDAILQDRLDQIDFMKNMDQITSQGAIGMLTNLLNMKDLTEKQRQDILMRIKGLQDELTSSMQGAFNLPDTVKVPSVYEVRRMLGINKFVKEMGTVVADPLGTGAPGSPSSASKTEAERMQRAAAGVVPSTTADYSNSNNNVTINGADFDQVVDWIKKYMGQGAQVTRTTTPRRH